MIQGEYDNAYTYLKEGMQVMQSIGHSRGAAITLTRLGAVALRLGRLSEAQQLLEESLEITRGFHDRWGIGNALTYLGLLAVAQGDLNRAESLIRQCAAIFLEDSDQLLHASNLAELGYILSERGDFSERQVFQDALQTAIRSQALPVALYALAGLASLYAQESSIEKALQLAMYIWQQPASNYQTRKNAEKLCSELASQLTSPQLEAVRSRAQSTSLDAIVYQLAS
jgi:tetratricopeptide (TPR) repeat protein